MRTAFFSLLGLWLAATLLRAQPGLALSAETDRKFYLEHADGEVYVAARINPGALATDAMRARRNVVFVLDRSGSMAGGRIDALREAVVTASASLAAEDFVSVVTFGSEVEVVLEAERREKVQDLAARLAQIQPVGGAALFDALNQAAAQLRRNAGPATVSEIILVTDGPPTKGPRSAEDLTRLAEAFAAEGLMVSTFGIGEEFEEDTLATMARVAQGRFYFVRQPADFLSAFKAELLRTLNVVGTDAVVTIEFASIARKIKSHGWRPGTIQATTVTRRLPRVFAEGETDVVASAEFDFFAVRFDVPDFAKVRLTWKSPADGQTHEATQVLPLHFAGESLVRRDSRNAMASRVLADLVVRESLQNAIEQIDKRDYRRALRGLRDARGELVELNFQLEDAAIAEKLRTLDRYLAEVQPRGLQAADRKMLRSGLFHRFDPPTPEPKE